MENLRIESPCPILMNRLDQHGNRYTCKSCKKEVIDFRGQTLEEITRQLTSDTCGIFTSDQLPGQQKMPLFRQAAFYALAVFSFLGFNVSPLNAAPTQAHASAVEVNHALPKKDKDKKKKHKKQKKSRKPTRTMGTPTWL